ncbi:DUF1217 domain-containing protein [Roseinatronobacter bogoriensis]|uniref:DUF1217 domain-containing protein n=1 Tax=Roseinatronobacter bogoriensis subsp. barguzinensis TaxID=441209 RepID=A0A2K8KDK5_9RHOB|nr:MULTISPECIES: DUF1217 domain-containing protein [Rhodobaca]ATX65805.1 DUF1217 domain-containing protein [Rhodobaca barguzinensis]MBB4208235.1 hypothetical protein [Rhodobaca bogoriensis DSM 18756]TDW38876.1 uncharacterized protein DUF1217 [Rhodobaca barguzinensis]TDY68941.1 uncharacterized protein DUF1217 [Rhodobaca bogoriensis DSM 18756]
MSFQPVLPVSGLAGWAFLNRTRERQEDSFNAAPAMQRDVAYFQEKFPGIQTAEELVSDRRLLRVTLGAFGLQDDLDNRAFIRQVIEGGTEERTALANRLADKRYFALSSALEHLAGTGGKAAPDDLIGKLTASYQGRAFEVSVGEQDQTLRLALTLQRELPKLAEDFSSETSRWYAALGNPPLREILETGLGLPKEFGRLDIDDQVTRMRAALQNRFGVSDLLEMSQPENLEKLTHRFLIMSQLNDMQSAMTSSSTALFLLQNAAGFQR